MWRRPIWRLLSSDDSCRPTGLVIRALGLIVGRLVRDEGDMGDMGDMGDIRRKSHLLLTTLITQAAQMLLEAHELDINPEMATSRRVGSVLRKMRLQKHRQPKTGKNGWIVSLDDVVRWSIRYGLEPSSITGLNINPLSDNITHITHITHITPATPHEGIL